MNEHESPLSIDLGDYKLILASLWFHTYFVVVTQSPSRVQLFMTLWPAACQASLSFSVSQSLSMSIESVMPSNHLILCHSLLLPPSIFNTSGSCPMSQLFTSGGQSIGASASASVLPKSSQSWFPLRLTGWISLQSKGLSRVFSHTTVQAHLFFGAQPSLLSSCHIHSHIQNRQIMRTNSSWLAGKWRWFPGRLIDTQWFPNSLLSVL